MKKSKKANVALRSDGQRTIKDLTKIKENEENKMATHAMAFSAFSAFSALGVDSSILLSQKLIITQSCHNLGKRSAC
jgi:hypothetical protein